MSEWLLFNATFFQLLHGENKFHTMKWWWCLLCTRPIRMDMMLHSDTLSWYRANQSLLLLRKAACWAKKQQISVCNILKNIYVNVLPSNHYLSDDELGLLLSLKTDIILKSSSVNFHNFVMLTSAFHWQNWFLM